MLFKIYHRLQNKPPPKVVDAASDDILKFHPSSNLNCFWTLGSTSKFEFLIQTDFDRNFCKLYVDRSFEERFDTCLAHFHFVSTWYE